MLDRDGAAKKISCKSKRRYRNKNITSNRTLYGKYTKPLRHVGIEEIAKVTRVDEYSKKLNLPAHLLTMVHFVIEDCKSLTELCGSLKGKHGKTHGLSSITKGQLSTVNRNRDYRVFCMDILRDTLSSDSHDTMRSKESVKNYWLQELMQLLLFSKLISLRLVIVHQQKLLSRE